MASCAGSTNSPEPLDAEALEKRAYELYKCVKKDQLVKAKFNLKGLTKAEKKEIVVKMFDGNSNASLFLAAQQGQVCHLYTCIVLRC